LSIKAISVSKTYSGPPVHAVKPTSIDINEGTFTLLCGPTGSGKTTLLAMLAGILSPSEGDVIFDTIRLSNRNDKKVSRFREQHIGFVPQARLFISELTVWENILSPHSFSSMSIKKLKSSALDLVERLGLAEKIHMRPFELSGGEIQKMMMTRALVKQPTYIFADEPCSELDNTAAGVIFKILDERKKQGAAVIVACHDHRPLRKNVDVYMMKDGKITDYRKGGAL
jgi:putative ABC transport system ATP-binding protein